MTGYVRKDTTNNIADGNVINAADLDSEFDGVQDGFNASTGHTHGGAAGEGAPITRLGPTQDVTASAVLLAPKTTNTVDIGSSALKFKDLFLAGNGSVGGTLAVTGVATFTAQPILSSLTASRAVFSDGSKGLVSNAITGTGNVVMSASPTLTGTAGLENITASGTLGVTGVATFTAQPIVSSLTASRAVFSDGSKGLVSNAITGTGNVVMSASPTLTGTIAAEALTASSTVTLSGGTANGVTYLNGSKVLTSGSALTFDGSRFFVGTTAVTTSSSQSGEVYSGGAAGFMFTNTTAANYALSVKNEGTSGTRKLINFYEGTGGGTARANISFDGSANFAITSSDSLVFSPSSAEGMRLTSTGLGIGTSSPQAKLQVAGDIVTNISQAFNWNMYSSGGDKYIANGYAFQTYFDSSGNWRLLNAPSNSSGAGASATLTERMRLDSAGNLGLGVTPSAWGAGYKAIQNGIFSLATDGTNNDLTANRYINSGGTSTYIANGYASMMRQVSGAFNWYTAPSGTAGDAISFTQAMTLTSGGNLGVGATSPTGRVDAAMTSGSLTGYSLSLGGVEVGSLKGNSTTGEIRIGGTYTNYFPTFYSSGTERARIDSSGNLLVGTTTNNQSSSNGNKFQSYGGIWVVNDGTTGGGDAFSYFNSTASLYRFYVTPSGTISATNTTITAISDQRLKENIRDLDDGLDVVMALKPRKFDWKAGKGQDIKNARGFIAQEFETVLPDMIETWKDPAPEGEEPYKAVNANLIPTLVKAMQEQQTIIESLKARLDAANL